MCCCSFTPIEISFGLYRQLSSDVAKGRVSSRIGLLLSMAMFTRKRVKFDFVPSCISAELWLNGASAKV